MKRLPRGFVYESEGRTALCAWLRNDGRGDVRQLARLLGCSRPHVLALRDGRAPWPKVPVLAALESLIGSKASDWASARKVASHVDCHIRDRSRLHGVQSERIERATKEPLMPPIARPPMSAPELRQDRHLGDRDPEAQASFRREVQVRNGRDATTDARRGYVPDPRIVPAIDAYRAESERAAHASRIPTPPATATVRGGR